jgi:hypothetical protein
VHDFQSLIFRSAGQWSAVTSLVVVAIGLLYTLQGFRFARFLLPLACAGGGLALGAILAAVADLPVSVAGVVAAVLLIVTLLRFRVALMLSSALTFGAAGQYLAVQLGMRPQVSLIIAGIGLAVGFGLVYVCRRTLPIIVTIIQGAGLLVVGFVGLSTGLVPSLGVTFADWSGRLPLMVPVLLMMLCTLGYTVQVNAYQGDIESGGRSGVRDLEAS